MFSQPETEDAIDAVLLMKRTGTVLGAWTRKDVNLEIISVMTATLLGSVESIVLAMGCESPQVLRVESERCQMLATRLTSPEVLVVFAPREVSEARVRRSMREIAAKLEASGGKRIPQTGPQPAAVKVARPSLRQR
ncbi:MAG: hypothetical protein E6K18_02185 [Methanobacteriota archaeon]|nr:MAG: hypothetical protein E6K18_02185 [Euryarchaeota archaeon]